MDRLPDTKHVCCFIWCGNVRAPARGLGWLVRFATYGTAASAAYLHTCSIQTVSESNPVVDNELWLAASQTSSLLERFFPSGLPLGIACNESVSIAFSTFQGLSDSQCCQVASQVDASQLHRCIACAATNKCNRTEVPQRRPVTRYSGGKMSLPTVCLTNPGWIL